jgi:tetratricopeptide (TPR) repeat protein
MQKDSLLRIIDQYSDDTVFICSDIDEIINPKNVNWIADIVRKNENTLIRIPLVHLEGKANLRVHYKDTGKPKDWTGMFLATKKHFKKGTPTQFRSNVNNPFPINFVTQNNEILQDLGWHFSWMGDSNIRKIKCQSFTHYDDTFSFLTTSKYKNKDTEDFHNKLLLQEGQIPPSGDKNFILKEYPIQNLPSQIFTLPQVLNFLLPENKYLNFNKHLFEYAQNVDDPISNLKMGYCYYQQGHTAPALSYFLRCAERTDSEILAYEALIYGYFCYKEQKIRDETAKSLIMHAVTLLPERPEARFLLSVFYEQKQMWMDSYYHANQGLKYDITDSPFIFYHEHPGKIGLLFQKAISGYWWGKNNESKNILINLRDNYQLTEIYKQGVLDNLKRLGIEST